MYVVSEGQVFSQKSKNHITNKIIPQQSSQTYGSSFWPALM